MRIVYKIFDTGIFEGIAGAVEEAEKFGEIAFPDTETRKEFIDDCTSEVIDKYESYETYSPDYYSIVLDNAKLYGYITV